MNEYKLGSVADLISQNKDTKIKQIKKNSEINQQRSSASELFNKNIDKTVVKKQKSKQKNISLKKNFQKDDTVINFDCNSLKNENFISKKKRKSLDHKNLKNTNGSNVKKRKKSNDELIKSSFKEFQLEESKPETGIDLKCIPCDSEKEKEKENTSVKSTKIKSQVSNQERKYKDYTECTVFVGNIPINYDKQKICKVFSKFGKIQSARIRCIPIADINMPKKVAAIKKQFNSKRNSLVAYVKYENQDSANAALKANGMVVDGHHLRVDLAEGKKENDNKKAVFVGGLPFDIEDDELWEFFQNCGNINSVRVIRDSQTSMGKGFGYVNFDSTAAVELALQMNGEELKKRIINVKRCIKARNKNKLNAFGRKKSKEITDQLLCKKGKKFKGEKKKKQNKGQELFGDFQGKKANIKEKKKKKLSKAVLRQRKFVKILGASKSC